MILSLCQVRYRKGIQMIKLQLCRLCEVPHLKTWKQPACTGFSLQDRAQPPALGWDESPRGRELSWLFCLPEQAGWAGEMQDGDVSKHLHHHAPWIPAVTEWHQQHEKPGCAGPFAFLSRTGASSHPSAAETQNCSWLKITSPPLRSWCSIIPHSKAVQQLWEKSKAYLHQLSECRLYNALPAFLRERTAAVEGSGSVLQHASGWEQA